MSDPRTACLKCGLLRYSRRTLCIACFNRLANGMGEVVKQQLREQYTRETCRGERDCYRTLPLAEEPTCIPPGPQRIEVYAARVEAGRAVFHPRDREADLQ